MGMPALKTDALPMQPRLLKTRFVAITANKGGVGKTTLAFSLAIGAAYEGWRVAIVDLDAQHGCDYLKNVRNNKMPYAVNIDVISDDIVNAADVLDRVDDSYDIVFVDCPPGVEKNENPVRALVNRADFVLVPTCSGILDMRACVNWLNSLRPHKDQNLAFVMNRANAKAKATDYMRDVLSERGRVCDGMVRELQIIEDDQKLGKTVFDHYHARDHLPPKKAEKAADQSRDMRIVWNYLRNEIGLR